MKNLTKKEIMYKNFGSGALGISQLKKFELEEIKRKIKSAKQNGQHMKDGKLTKEFQSLLDQIKPLNKSVLNTEKNSVRFYKKASNIRYTERVQNKILNNEMKVFYVAEGSIQIADGSVIVAVELSTSVIKSMIKENCSYMTFSEDAFKRALKENGIVLTKDEIKKFFFVNKYDRVNNSQYQPVEYYLQKYSIQRESMYIDQLQEIVRNISEDLEDLEEIEEHK